MKKIKGISKIASVLVALILLNACFAVKVRQNVKNPDRYFKKAYQEIEDIHRRYPKRDGRARRINVLVYDADERELVQVSAPFWIVNKCMDIAEDEDDFELEERYDFDWRGFKDFGRIGPGLLVEIEDEEAKVLIWIN